MIQPATMLKGRYRVGRRLGEGGMAIVYQAHDLVLGREVAIKTLRSRLAADPAFRARFAREARAAASLSHPNIIDVHDVGEEDGTPFLVMELVLGQPLKAIIAAEAPFHPADVAELLTQVASALDYAHGRGYVHRDIKPGNILIDEHGRVRVVDFGIAKSLAEADVTDTGAALGTVGYLSPEQAQGLMATPASDVYSAGVLAFEMLTGTLPFHADTPVGVAMLHINEPAPPPSARLSSVPRQVDAVILRALEKDPTRRWPSVGAFAAALMPGQTVSPPIPEAPPRPEASARVPTSALPTLAVAILVSVALIALVLAGTRGIAGFIFVPGTTETPAPTGSEIDSRNDDERATRAAVIEIEPAAEEPTLAPTAPAPTPAPTIAPVAAVEPVVVVPNLQGLTIAGSTGALLPLGLRVALDQPVYSDTIPMNAVVSQEPRPGSAVPAGTVVHVSLSRGRSPFGNTSP